MPVKVQLTKTVDGKTTPVGDPVELNAENDWSHAFTDLPEWQLVDGKKASISYSVEELAVDGFTSAVTGDAASGFTITNTQTPPPTTEVSVNKVWKSFDGKDLDPALTMPVKVQLMESTGGEKSPVGDPVELNSENGWKHTFTGLPLTKSIDGKQVDIAYSVEELEVDGYTSIVTGNARDGFTITNTQIPPQTPPTPPTPPATPPTPPTPPATPPVPEKPRLPLPRTGTEVGAAAALAIALMAVGVAIVRRRKP